MSQELQTHLEEAQREFHAALQALEGRDRGAARLHYLQAAQALFLAAALSPAGLRESRKALAQQLMAEGEWIAGGAPLPPAAARPAAPTPATPPLPAAAFPTARPSAAPQPAQLGDDTQAGMWLVQQRPDVRFSDIAGLEGVKEDIRLKLLYPFSHPDLAQQYNINPGGGILLYGPPGTGKTMIARAIAGEIDAAFFAIKPSEVMSQWVGVAEQNIARLFAEAESYPVSVIFIDEMESLAPRRRANQSTVMARVVPQLLAEMDGFEKRANPVLVVGATNEPWSMDSAVLRPGRLDRLIYVPPPDVAARRRILELNLKNVPLDEDVSLDEIAARTERFSGADMAAVARRVRERAFSQAVREGLARPLQVDDFQAVLADQHPSIPVQDIQRFERFARVGLES